MSIMRALGLAIALIVAGSATVCAQAQWKKGDKVEAFSPMTQSWQPATIESIDGTRYFVHAQDPKLASPYWGATESMVRAIGSGGAAAPAPPPGTPPVGAGREHDGRPEGSSRTVRGADGQNHLIGLVGAGDEMPFGTWHLQVGGQFVKDKTEKTPSGTRETHKWGGPETSGTLTIKPDGSWSAVEPSGGRSQGRWTDLGNNIVELKNYDSADWTASTWKGAIHVLHPVGKHEYGRR